MDEVEEALLQVEAFPLLPHPEVIALIVDDAQGYNLCKFDYKRIYGNVIIKYTIVITYWNSLGK